MDVCAAFSVAETFRSSRSRATPYVIFFWIVFGVRTHSIGRTWVFITPLFVQLVGYSVVPCTLCLVGISEPTRSNHRANSFVDVISTCVSGDATYKLALFLKFVFCTQVCAVPAAELDLLQPFIVFTPCWNIATCRDALSLMSRLWLWSAGAACTLCRRTHDGRVDSPRPKLSCAKDALRQHSNRVGSRVSARTTIRTGAAAMILEGLWFAQCRFACLQLVGRFATHDVQSLRQQTTGSSVVEIMYCIVELWRFHVSV